MKKTAIFIAIAMASTLAQAAPGTAFLKGERVSGMNKICYYDDLGSTLAITVSAYEICPMFIRTK